MNRLINRETGTPVSRWGLWDSDLDRVLDGFLRPVRWVEEAAGALAFPLDVNERADEYLIAAELPGVKKDDINVTLENGVLTISAESKSEQTEKEGERPTSRLVRQERRYGKYVRSLRLGTQINERAIKASYKDGVLQLTLPKVEEVKPKKISVSVD